MSSSQVHKALRQVQEIRQRIIERQLFRGYSGVARLCGGWLALCAACVMSLPWYPHTVDAFVLGWGSVCALAFLVNLGAVLFWHFKKTNPQLTELRPVIDAVSPLVVGGILTLALLRIGAYDLLPGTWMCLFGIVNIASRHALPQSIFHLGWCYIACGVFVFVTWPEGAFLNPWPMGLVFFIGESTGGIIFMQQCTDPKEILIED